MPTDPAITAAGRALKLGGNARVAIDAAREALKPIRERHRKVYPVFSWNGGIRLHEPCRECDGKAGVHPCGCWADADIEYCCATCRDERGRLIDWPCPDARDAYPKGEL